MKSVRVLGSRPGTTPVEPVPPPGLDLSIPPRAPLELSAVQIDIKGTYGRNAVEPLPKRKR